MTVTAVIGLQWGDEGKGKIVDVLAQQSDMVVRFNGGNNAGHTIKNELGVFKLHLVPSGAFNLAATCIIGPGVIIDPAVLYEEIVAIEARGVNLRGRLHISPRCHLIMPYHTALDTLYEKAKGGDRSTGTTGRGIGPTFADKASYNGIRIADLSRRAVFSDKLRMQLQLKNPMLEMLGGAMLDEATVRDQYLDLYAKLLPYISETFGVVQEGLRAGKNILLEGAQAALLDPDWGTYPFSTGSTTLVSAATAGAGVPPRAIERIIGVCKAYTTRVGNGPMPTELLDATGDLIRKRGNEYGSTTGRPRRVGWFDAELVGFTAALNGVTELAVMLLDVLDAFDSIEFGTGYSHAGQPARYYDGDATFLDECAPIYNTLPGWRQEIGSARSLSDLPATARAYVERIAVEVGVPLGYVSVGPDRAETIRT